MGIKKNALKCLNVIFRDLSNYSKEQIPKILEPTWTLFLANLSLYIETQVYDQPLTFSKQELDKYSKEDLLIGI